MIQDIASCQLEVSQVSRDYWPDRPLDSVPSIFRRQKISAIKAKRVFAELVEAGGLQGLPIALASQRQSAASNRSNSISKEKPKRGRPKKNSQDGAVSSNATSTKSASDLVTGSQQSGKKVQA